SLRASTSPLFPYTTLFRSVIGVTDVHTGPFAHRIQSFQYFDTGRIVQIIFAHASLRWSWVIRPCSTWNMATGVSVRQPSFNKWRSEEHTSELQSRENLACR